MVKILLVEDSKMFSKVISDKITNSLGFTCLSATSLYEAKELVENDEHTFVGAILDLNLPDAPNGEIVDYIAKEDIPIIVLTGTLNKITREKILAQNVMDYVLKEGVQSIDQVIQGVERIHRNSNTTVLVVDDSKISRKITASYLQIQRFNVLEATNGQEALDILRAHPYTKLVVTDYNMPVMDGFELVSAIRKNNSLDKIGIIGISAQGNPMLSARFLKLGANDFISKPFAQEEFSWRVNQSVELLDYISKVRDAAILDYLTGLFNRRYFFEIGTKLFENAKLENRNFSVAILDIDHFKKVNDTYGHDYGDKVLKEVSSLIASNFKTSDVVARYGGEEFCIIATNSTTENCFDIFDSLRQKIEKYTIELRDKKLHVTVSIGVQATIVGTLDETIKLADEMLYEAKNEGRNRVLVSR